VSGENPDRFDVRLRTNNEHAAMVTEIVLLDSAGNPLGGAGFSAENNTWLPLLSFIGTCGDCLRCEKSVDIASGLVYTWGNGGVKILGFDGDNPPQDLWIPDRINNQAVVEIGAFAFENLENLRSVRIPGRVSYIGWGAFAGSSVESVTFAEPRLYADEEHPGMTIDMLAFADTANLVSIDFPDHVRVLEMSSFQDSGLTSVTFGAGIRAIQSGAFVGTGLTSNDVLIPTAAVVSANAFDTVAERIIFTTIIGGIDIEITRGDGRLLFSNVNDIPLGIMFSFTLRAITSEGIELLGFAVFEDYDANQPPGLNSHTTTFGSESGEFIVAASADELIPANTPLYQLRFSGVGEITFNKIAPWGAIILNPDGTPAFSATFTVDCPDCKKYPCECPDPCIACFHRICRCCPNPNCYAINCEDCCLECNRRKEECRCCQICGRFGCEIEHSDPCTVCGQPYCRTRHNCRYCGRLDVEGHRCPGNIVGNVGTKPTVNDALAILRHIVGLTSVIIRCGCPEAYNDLTMGRCRTFTSCNNPVKCPIAWDAALILPNDEKNCVHDNDDCDCKPTVLDALAILRFLVGLESRYLDPIWSDGGIS
jgi:hypothetical protein